MQFENFPYPVENEKSLQTMSKSRVRVSGNMGLSFYFQKSKKFRIKSTFAKSLVLMSDTLRICSLLLKK